MDNDEKEKSNSDSLEKRSSKSPSSQREDVNNLSADETARKRRRNSTDSDANSSTAAAKSGDSKLTIQNVADHEKRCEQEERENSQCKENDEFNGRNAASQDPIHAIRTINLDEVVDTFSTMATDGSRHSMCGSCDGDTKDEEKAAAAASIKDAKQVIGEANKANDTVIKIDQQETSDPQSNDYNNAIDADGNITDPDLIGEPNEPLLAQWEPDRGSRKYAAVKSTSGENSRDSDIRGGSSDDHSLMAASPSGGSMFYEATSTTPTRDGDESLDDVMRRSLSPYHHDDDEEDSMVTGKSGETGATAASTALDNADWLLPPHKWNAVKAWRNREFGYSSTKSPELFTSKANGSLHFVQRLELMYKMEAHEGCVNCLHFNASGTRLASGSDDLNIIIWDWTTNRPLITIESGHRANVFQAKFMPLSGDCHVVSCARDGQVRLAELSVRGVCKSTRKLAQHRGPSHKLALVPDSPHTFLSCGDDAVVFELDLRDPKPNRLLICKERRTGSLSDSKVPLYSIHSHPRNPYYFAICGRDPFCRMYDKRMTGDGYQPVKKFCPEHLIDDDHKVNVTAAVFNYDGSELLGTYNDEDIYLFETGQQNEREYKHRYKGHRNNSTVKGVNFYGPRSEFIVSGSDCGYIYFWEKESETIVQFLPGDEAGVVNVLEPHPTCAMLATSGLDHDVKIWVPSCEDPKLDVKKLQKLMRQNGRERERDRRHQPEFIDSQMLWYIMSRMRRNARRAEQGEGSDETAEDSDTDNTDNDEDAADGPMAVQCRPS